MLRRASAILLGFCIFTAAHAGAAKPLGPTNGVEPLVKTLDNGVTVAIIENHESPVVALRLYVKAGSMTEGEYLGAGVSHFLEHLVSGGTTRRRTEAESRKLLDAIGAQCNAYTSKNHTCYYITTASRFGDDALDLLTDWVMNAAITQEEFDREYDVIQNEMDSTDSNARRALHNLMSHTMFKVHPTRHPVIGYREAFRKLKRSDVVTYYNRTYVPNNVIFVVAGDVKPRDALRKIRAAFKPFERRPVPVITLPQEPPQLGPRKAAKEMPVGQAYMRLAFRTVPLSHPDLYPLDLISYVLSNGNSSRLLRKLREEKRLVSSITTWSYTPGYDAGEFAVSVTLDPAKIPEARAAILKELRLLTREPISKDELERAKRQKVSDHVYALQTVEGQAASVAIDLLSAKDPHFSRRYVERIQKTTRQEMMEAARKYLREDRLCVAVVRPPEARKEAAPKPDRAAAARRAKIIKLPNGLRLILKRNPSQPIVALRALFLAGLRAEPKEKQGISLFTARMMPRGAAGRSAEEIARTFDEMGGALSASSGNNSLYLSATCLSEDLPTAMTVFAAVIRKPGFPAGEIERLRPLLIAARKRQRDNWRTELVEEFRQGFFTAHPYRNSPLGSVAQLRRISREDIVTFHKSWCVPNNMVLAVFGDVDPPAATALVKKLFGNWPASPGFKPPAPAAEPRRTKTATLRRKTRHPLGTLFIGFPGHALRDVKDGYAMDVLDALVSGISLPRGWLHKALRGKDVGLVYEVHAYDFPGIEPGYFGVYAGCVPENIEKVKAIILDQLARLEKEPIPPEELAAACRVCITADVLDNQTKGRQAMSAALDELYGLGYDHGRRYADGIQSVTAEDVKRVARKTLRNYLCILMQPEESRKPTR